MRTDSSRPEAGLHRFVLRWLLLVQPLDHESPSETADDRSLSLNTPTKQLVLK